MTATTALTPRTLAQLHRLPSDPKPRFLSVTTIDVAERFTAPGRGLLDQVAMGRLSIFRVSRGRVVDVDYDRQEYIVDPFNVLTELGDQLSAETIATIGEVIR
jgi:hypothetical protein